jgi:hypothetical protein
MVSPHFRPARTAGVDDTSRDEKNQQALINLRARYDRGVSVVDDSAVERPRRGRRPGASGTRQAILEAARARFAADGYGGTTIRRVAADAGVDPSLVMQFFRSKELLFGAVMSISPDAMAQLSDAFNGP